MLKTQDILKKQLNNLTDSIKKLWASKIFKIYLVLMAASIFALFFEAAAVVLCTLIFLLAFVLPVGEMIGVLLFYYPFFSIFMFKGVNLYFVLFAAVIGVFAVKHLIKVIKKQEKLDWLFIVSVLIYLVYIILPIRHTAAGKFKTGCDMMYFASALAFFVMLYVVYKNKDKIDYLKCLHLFIVGFLISGGLGWFAYVSPRLKNVMSLIDYIGIDLLRYNGLFGFPNTLAIVGLMAAAVVFYLQHKGKIGNVAYLYHTLIFALCYITLARSFLYAYFGAFALFVIATMIKEKKNCWKIILPEVLCVLVVMAALFMYTKAHFGRVSVSDLISGYDNSVDSEDISQIVDPGRGGLIKIYAKDFLSGVLVMLFGRGLSATWIGGTRKLSSHNTYLQALWNTGFVGLILFVVIMVLIIKKYSALKLKPLIKSTFIDFGNYILILPILAMMFIENLFMNMQMIIAVMVVLFAISVVKLNKNLAENQEEKAEENPDEIKENEK